MFDLVPHRPVSEHDRDAPERRFRARSGLPDGPAGFVNAQAWLAA
jgi:hypothetical protein